MLNKRGYKKKELTFSQLAVKWLLNIDPRIKVNGFQEALRTILKQHGLSDKQARQAVKDIGYRMIPDAYLIDYENSAVYAFEVEDSNVLIRQKLSGFQNLWWLLDEMSWSLRLLFLDRYAANWRTLPLFETALFDMEGGTRRISAQKEEKINWEKVHARASENSWLFPFVSNIAKKQSTKKGKKK